MNRVYQWTKGDKKGQIVKTDGKTITMDNVEYLIFEDSSMMNTILLNEYLIEIPSENEPIFMQDLAPQPLQLVEKRPQKTQEVVRNNDQTYIENLLSKSKKTKEYITITLDVELPPAELLKIIASSYDNGDEEVLKCLTSSIQMDKIREKIGIEIKKKFKTPKTKNQK